MAKAGPFARLVASDCWLLPPVIQRIERGRAVGHGQTLDMLLHANVPQMIGLTLGRSEVRLAE